MTNSDIVRFLIKQKYKLVGRHRINHNTLTQTNNYTMNDVIIGPTGHVSMRYAKGWGLLFVNTWNSLNDKPLFIKHDNIYHRLVWTYSKYIWLVIHKGTCI